MKVLVAYATVTGNTEKIAKAIAAAVENSDLVKLPTDKNPEEYDFIFSGFWCDKGQPDAVWEAFFKRTNHIPCAVFGTLGGDPNSERGRAFAEKVRTHLNCESLRALRLWQGKVDPKILEAMAKMPGAKPMTEERKAKLAEGAKHPTQEDQSEAALWARKVVTGK